MKFQKVALPQKVTTPGTTPGLSASSGKKTVFKKVELPYQFSLKSEPQKQFVVYSPKTPKVETNPLSTPRMTEAAIAGAHANPLETARQAELRAKSAAIPKPVYNKVTHIADTHTTLGEVVRSAVKGLDVARLGLIETGRENMAALDIRSVAEFWRTHQNGGTFNEGKTWRTYTPEQAKIEYEKAMKDAEIADRVAVNAQSNLETVIKNNPDRYLPEFTGDATHDQTLQFSYELGQNATSQVISMGLSAATGGLAAPLIAPLFGLWSAQSKYAQSIGAGKDVTKAYRSAVISGIVNWVGEYAQLSMFGAGKGAANLVSSGDALQGAMNTLAKNVSMNTLAQVKARLASIVGAGNVIGGAISGLAGKYGAKAIAGDIFENAFQEFIESAGESIGDWVTGNEKYNEDTLKEAWNTACKSAIMGALLAGATTIVSNGVSYSVDNANLSRVQQVQQNIETKLNQEVEFVNSEIQKVDSAMTTPDLARLQTLRNWIAKKHTISENKEALGGERFDGMSLVSVSNGTDPIRDAAVTAHVAKLVGQSPVDGIYTMEEGPQAGVTVHEKSFILPKDIALKIASVTNQESIALRDGGVWKFINVKTGEQMGDSFNGIDYHPAPGVPQTKVQTKNRGYFSFTFTNIQPTDKNKEAIQQKVEAQNPLADYTLSGTGMLNLMQPNEFSGTAQGFGMESVGTAQLPIGSYDRTIQKGTSNFTSVTEGNTTESTVRVADKIINWSGSVVKRGTVEVIQTTVGDKGEKVDNTPQLQRNIEDIRNGNFVITANGADAQFLSGIEFTQAGVRGAWAQGADISAQLKDGKTHIILIYELAGKETPRGHITYPSLINNPTYVALLEMYAPDTMQRLRAEAAKRQVSVDEFNAEMAPILAKVGKNEALKAEALARWNATHPEARPLSKLKLKDDVAWYDVVTVKEEAELNKYAVLMTTPHNRDAHDRVVGAFVLNGCYEKDNFIFPREVQTVVNTYHVIDWGTAIIFKKPVAEQFVRSKLVSSVVEVTGQKKSLFDFSKTAQKQEYVASAKEMRPVIDEILSSLEEFVNAKKETGQSTLMSSAEVNTPMELEKYGVERLPQENLDMIQSALDKYHKARSSVSNYTVQFGTWDANRTTAGTGTPPPIATAVQTPIATVTPEVTGNGFSIVDKIKNKIVRPIVAFLDIKKKPLETQSNLDHSRELWTDDLEALRNDGMEDGSYKQLSLIRSTATQAIKSVNEGLVMMPDGKGQLFLKDVKVDSFSQLGERLKAAGKKWKDLNDFSIIYAALKGFPVNKNSMQEVNLVAQGSMAKVQANAQMLMNGYSAEDKALFMGIIDDAHKYILPMAQYMASRGMIDTKGLSVEEFVDRYVSASPKPEEFKFSSPIGLRDIENVTHRDVVDFLDGIGNAINHYAQFIEYNEYVKNFAEKHGYVSDHGAVTFFDDAGNIRHVQAPAHIERQLQNIINTSSPTWGFLNNTWYRKAMALSRFTKIATPAFAQLNLIRDGELVLLRYGVHPATMIQTIFKQIGFKAEKASGLVGMGTPNETEIAKTKLTKMLQYTKDNLLGISESLMRNYAYNVEEAKGKTDVDQMYALIAGSTDFTVHGSSQKAANLRGAWQFAQASLNVAQSWDMGIKEVINDMSSSDAKIRVEAFTKAAILLAVMAAAVVYKEREKEKKELQDYIIDNKIPVRIGNKIIAIPESFSTGTMIENSIASVIAGIKMNQSLEEITSELALDTYAGIVGYIGRDGDPNIKSIVSTMSPTLFEPIVRSFLNVQYGGRTIDPYTYGANWTHYFNSTSKVAKNVAVELHDHLGIDVSPIQLEFLFKSYLGRYGTYITKMDDQDAKGFISDYFAQQFVSPVPEGIKTQAYSDWNRDYAKVKDDLLQARKGNYKLTQNMANDLLLMEKIEKSLKKQGTAQGVYALSIFGLSVLESYKQHKAEAK